MDLENRSAEQLVSIRQDDSLQVSENHEIIVWQEGDDINHSNQLNVRNLNTGEQTVIRAEDGEAIRPLGFRYYLRRGQGERHPDREFRTDLFPHV